MNEAKITLEERFENLENIISQMESNKASLDESFNLYKKGIDEIKAANEALDQIEKAMLVLNESNELEEF